MIVSRVLYALLNKIDSILRKAHKFGYTNEVLKVTDMLQNADNKLFLLMFRCSHCLHTLLPDLKVIDIVLRNSGASICLTTVINCTNSRLSIHVFFCDCYWHWHVLLCWTFTGRLHGTIVGPTGRSDDRCKRPVMLFDLIWFIIFSPHNWMAFVRLNKRHVMLCYGHLYCLFVSSCGVSSHQIPALIDSIWWVALVSVCTDVSYFTGICMEWYPTGLTVGANIIYHLY